MRNDEERKGGMRGREKREDKREKQDAKQKGNNKYQIYRADFLYGKSLASALFGCLLEFTLWLIQQFEGERWLASASLPEVSSLTEINGTPTLGLVGRLEVKSAVMAVSEPPLR